ncbi:hypothetical protein ACFYWP_37005 [Actinacidiphila glaucinigra]|uniref:hypothetical protein n=1 Tax=Actinacidiphila glaucinigra TaxID=235986 RepID=UPI0036935836
MTRRTRGPKAILWGAGALAGVVLLLTGYAALTGGDAPDPTGQGGGRPTVSAAPSRPAPTYTRPEDWTEPTRWAALPRGARTDARRNEIGFPHTTEGAMAMLAAYTTSSMDGSRSLVDDQVATYQSYVAAADQSPANDRKVQQTAARAQKSMLDQLGAGDGGLPSGAYVRVTAVGYKIIGSSRDQVSAYLLSRVVTKAGETQGEQASYTRTVAGAIWESGDWRVSTAATLSAIRQEGEKPAIVAPGDADFNGAGWTAIRAAS